MGSNSRTITVFAGLALIYAGLLLLAGLLEQRWLCALIALGIALIMFRLTLSLSASKPQIVLAVVAVPCFLLNPVVSSSVFWIPDTVALREAALAVIFCSLWFAIEHWSLFMRSLSLAILYALMIWVGSAVTAWVPVALLFWALFNRKPLAAFVSLLMILGGGFFLYVVTWGVLHLFVGPQTLWVGSFLEGLRLEWVSRTTAPIPRVPAAAAWLGATYSLWFFSCPLLLLVLRTTANTLIPAMRSRRTDGVSFEIFLFWTLLISWFGQLLINSTFREGDLVACVALAIPLVIRDIKARDFFSNRPILLILLGGVAVSTVVTFIGLRKVSDFQGALWLGPGLTLLGLLLGFLFAWTLPSARRLNASLRATAILSGWYAGFCLGFLDQFFKR